MLLLMPCCEQVLLSILYRMERCSALLTFGFDRVPLSGHYSMHHLSGHQRDNHRKVPQSTGLNKTNQSCEMQWPPSVVLLQTYKLLASIPNDRARSVEPLELSGGIKVRITDVAATVSNWSKFETRACHHTASDPMRHRRARWPLASMEGGSGTGRSMHHSS